jgi:hypothetical protein
MLSAVVVHYQNHCHYGLKFSVPKIPSETMIKLAVSGTLLGVKTGIRVACFAVIWYKSQN